MICPFPSAYQSHKYVEIKLEALCTMQGCDRIELYRNDYIKSELNTIMRHCNNIL